MRSFSVSALAAGLLAAFVGFASTFAVVLRGLVAAGASPQEAASGLMAISIAMGLCAIVLSLRLKMPISVVWSTPGAALLAASAAPEGGFAAAVGAFMACALLLVAAGSWPPLAQLVARIPAPLANAMLAGILLPLCLAPVKAVAQAPALGLPVVLVWALVARVRRLYAVPAAVLVVAAIIAAQAGTASIAAADWWPHPVFTMPVFSGAALVGVALPLFVVTMASQNIPGMAVLAVNGYRPAPGPLFRATGLFGLLAAPFGSHAVNLAAITAALCAGPDAHPDPARRYWAAAAMGAANVVLGLMAGAATSFVAASPPLLIEAVAGLALLGAFGGALLGAVADPADREAAVVTFAVAASGLTILGIGAAFWGLLAGGAIMALGRWRP